MISHVPASSSVHVYSMIPLAAMLKTRTIQLYFLSSIFTGSVLLFQCPSTPSSSKDLAQIQCSIVSLGRSHSHLRVAPIYHVVLVCHRFLHHVLVNGLDGTTRGYILTHATKHDAAVVGGVGR